MNSFAGTFIFLGVFLFFGCSSTHLKNDNTLQVKDAYYYEWTGGVEGASGTTVVILIDNPDSLTPKYLYFLGKKTPLEVKKAQGITQWIAHLHSSEKSDMEMNKNKENEAKNLPPADGISLKLKEGEAIILYTDAGKSLQHKIDKIRKEKRVFYP